MSVTATQKETLQAALNQAAPGKLPDALAKTKLGNILSAVEYDTGVIAAPAATVAIPSPGALAVQSVRVVSGDESNTPHVVCDSSETPAAIVAGLYSVALSADGKTLTFSDLVEQAIVRYIPNPANSLTGTFANS